DQGADIVAVRDGLRLVVQCKRLSKPVGNAAVQEAAAALRYWDGDRAAVVSNAGFTPAARRLATATGAPLLPPAAPAAIHPARHRARNGHTAPSPFNPPHPPPPQTTPTTQS
ncbi:restriction endonuclease, partial [Methylobacterium radiotolerans]|uniref:restriction endonuclease n=1 Tax=Methylobacterium radiotolerans TaxID=31998 RepID=UPI001FD90F5D